MNTANDSAHAFLINIIDADSDLVFAKDQNGTLIFCNEAFRRAYQSADTLVGVAHRDLHRIVAELEIYEQREAQVFNDKNIQETLETFTDATGRQWQMRCKRTFLNSSDQAEPVVLSVFTDITDQRVAEEQLRLHITQDSVTGLSNRKVFRDTLMMALGTGQLQNEAGAIMFIEIHQFRELNEALGYYAGDELLKEAARRILNACPQRQTLARVGGDEFGLMIAGVNKPDDVINVAQQLIAAFESPFTLMGNHVELGINIGISIFPHDDFIPEELLKNADLALAAAKTELGSAFRFFEPEMKATLWRRQSIAMQLRPGLEQNEFCLHYQPQIDVHTGKVNAVEALIRWQLNDGSTVLPSEFIPIAEDIGLIIPISRWVLDTACKQLKSWQTDILTHQRLAINLSSVHFKQSNLVDMIEKTIAQYGITPDKLDFEISESTLSSEYDYAVKCMYKLRDLGVNLTVEDFGSGNSPLSAVKDWPVQKVKIAERFVHEISCNGDAVPIASAIIEMAHALDLKVVAEGVEDQQQFEFLKTLGFDLVQGYYYTQPLPAEAMENWIQSHYESIDA